MKEVIKVFNELIETILTNSSNNEAVITNVKLWADSWKKEMNEAINYSRCCKSDSEQLPTKKYEIDFGGNALAGLEITNNEPKIIGAINGWGNGISKDEITITEK